MPRNPKIKNYIPGLFLSLCFAPAPAHACSVCFGNSSSPQIKAIIAGVVLLLGVTGSVLGGIGFTAFRWAQRAKNLPSV